MKINKRVFIFYCPGFSSEEMEYLKTKFEKVMKVDPNEWKDIEKDFAKRDECYDIIKKTNLLILGGTKPRVPDNIIEEAIKLECIIAHSAGKDQVPKKAWGREREGEIKILNLPCYATKAVSDLIIGYLEKFSDCSESEEIFSKARRLIENQRSLFDQTAKFGGIYLGEESEKIPECLIRYLNGKIFGILGLGGIGSDVVKKLYLNDSKCKIRYFDIKESDLERNFRIERVGTLDELFSKSDVILISVASKEETKNLVTASLIKLIPHGSIIINVSRKNAIKNKAYEEIFRGIEANEMYLGDDVLIESLLDPDKGENVEEERILNRLAKYPSRVILTPHIGFLSKQSINRKIIEFKKKVNEYLEMEKG